MGRIIVVSPVTRFQNASKLKEQGRKPNNPLIQTRMMTPSLAEHDAEILENLLASRAEIASRLLSERLGISPKVTERTPKEAGDEYLAIKYSATLEKYGLRQVELLISIGGGRTMAIGKELLKRDQVAYVARTIGQFNIDLRAEVFVQTGEELVNLIEEVKAMQGVKDMVWSEVIEVVGRKNHIPAETLAALRKKEAIIAIQ
jgi:DNA-binding Lrp family transcriptional regulator